MSASAEALPSAARREDAAALRMRRILTHLAIFAVVIGAWELLGAMGQLNELILPAPSNRLTASAAALRPTLPPL